MTCFLPISKKLARSKDGPPWWGIASLPVFGRCNPHEMSQGECWQNLSIHIQSSIIRDGSIRVRSLRVSAQGLKSYYSYGLHLQGDLFWDSFCVRRKNRPLPVTSYPGLKQLGWPGPSHIVVLIASFVSFKKTRRRWLRLALGPISFSHCSNNKTAYTHSCRWAGERVAPLLLRFPSWLVCHNPLGFELFDNRATCLGKERHFQEQPSFWLSLAL